MSTKNLTEFRERIKFIREQGKLTRDKFGEKLNVSGAYIGQLENGKKDNPSELFISAVIEKFGINPVWLNSGRGEMKSRPFSAIDFVRDNYGETYNDEKFVKIGVYYLAGAGTPNDVLAAEPIDHVIVHKEFIKPELTAVKVRGKSMEPIILDGAIVGVDRADKFVVSGEIYAVWLPYEGAVIKRIYLDTEKITLKSDNPRFPDVLVALDGLDEHFIQGRVKWVIQML